MCEYCGCHQNPYIATLMDEHDQLAALGDSAVRELRGGDLPAARAHVTEFTALLKSHNDVEERGMFAAIHELGEFVEVTEELAAEHVDLHDRLDAFGDTPPLADLIQLLADLAEHVEKENRGVFPFAYSAFSTGEWKIVEHAHRAR